MSITPRRIILIYILSLVLISGCTSNDAVSTNIPSVPTYSMAEVTPSPTEKPPATTSVEPENQQRPDDWQNWPAIPVPSERMMEVYQHGQLLGRDPRRFSKVGDCQNVSSYFLGVFDSPGDYRLGNYQELRSTIDHFQGSWSRESLAVKGGMNVLSQLTPYWADATYCGKTESPLACEIRVHNPSIIIISLETWWGQQPAQDYETAMRQVVEYVLAQGVIPILATKADNLEGDHSINAAIARIAYEYEVPLWNFWAIVQPLPGHGLTEDGFHLTYAQPFFDDPVRMEQGWPWRNLTALQAIDSVWRNLSNE